MRDKVRGESSSSLLSSQLLWNYPDHLKSIAKQPKELTMFTHHVIMELKPNTTTTEFTNVVESKILPLLRKEEGEAYNVSGYPEVLKTLTSLVEGTPRVGAAELATSTLHKLAAAKTA